MNKYKLLIPSALITLLTACEPKAPDSNISVSTDNTTYKVGQPVTFIIDGDADNILFFSGEPGHEYDLRDQVTADNHLLVDFVSYTDYYTAVHPNFQVLISSDFNGKYDAENLAKATWTDVTSRFELPTSTGTNTPSGTADLSDCVAQGEGVMFYIAVRYFDLDGVPQKNRWVVRSMNITKMSPQGVITTLADIKTAGWQNVIVSGTAKWTLPGTQLLAAGNTSTSNKDFWAVSTGYDLRKAEPSTGIVIKNISTTLTSYTYTYDKPGTYEAVFAAASEWYNSASRSVVSVKVVVTE